MPPDTRAVVSVCAGGGQGTLALLQRLYNTLARRGR
jgi:hypothetical protein